MYRKFLSLIIFSFSATFSFAQSLGEITTQQPQDDSIQSTIVLIGDAGQLTNGKNPVVEAVRKIIPLTKKTTILYLGDNLYKTGLPDAAIPTYDIAKAPLDSQIVIARGTPSKVYFIPGNHDWANGARTGYESILRVQTYIDILGNNKVKMLPRDGCPGPEEIKITDDVTMVVMDSQWWLQGEEKPGVESDCPCKTKDEVLTQLEDILAKNSKQLVIFGFHHPLRSYGPHGGYFTIKQHIFPFTDIYPNFYFPLPILGSAYPLTRAVFGTIQDLKHPLYQAMIRQVEKVVKSHPNVIFASGHEHTLQMIKDSGYNYIVSGSGSKSNRVSKGRYAEYVSSKNGFVTLDISKNKQVQASFYTVDKNDKIAREWTGNILDFSKYKEEKIDSLRMIPYSFKDSVLISASDKYKNPRGFRKAIIGKNYRDEWGREIALKEFNINKVKGGLKIKSLGGGKQTKSLKLEDKNGKEWTLRTIDKDPEKAIPDNLRGSMAQGVVQDMISAAHPYAPNVVAALAIAENIPAAMPELYFVPDDPQLGIYRDMFANTVCYLEDRQPIQGKDDKSSAKIINKMFEDNDHHVYQPAVLHARLLDMLVGDWDRHADQWKWVAEDTGKGKLYYPIPRDRDQAFFKSDGLLIKFAQRHMLIYMRGFNKNIGNINDFNWVARNFDRTFLNSLDEPTWKSITDSFVAKMTDDVILKSVQAFPKEIAATDAKKVANILMSRRDQLSKKSLDYYKFISKTVTVTGSNEQELFHIKNVEGKPELSVWVKKGEQDSLSLMYKRLFDPKVTKELILYGLNNNDKFVVDENVPRGMMLRIIGGKGADTFDIKGKMRNHLYDLTTEKNVVLNSRNTNMDFSPLPEVLRYEGNKFEYNKLLFPQLNLGYNSEDGILLGAGFTYTTHGFRADPYKSRHKLTTLFAPKWNAAKQVKYRGEMNQAISKRFDVMVNADYVSPTLNNFFGFGNSTVIDKSKPRSYYLARYKYISADLLLRKRMFSDVFSFSIGPSFLNYWAEPENNTGKVLSNPAIVGLDSANVYSQKRLFGGKAYLDINFIDNELFPTRGITWYTAFESMRSIDKKSQGISKLTSDMTVYATVSDESKITTILRAGGGKIFSKNPEYFQALTLGANNFVRGYRKDRFSGTGLIYGGAELRFRLFKSRNYYLPGDIGLIGYYDVGRVWYPGESSKKWHQSPGGGIYYAPFNMAIIGATMGFSPEDHLINISVGTKINLNF